MNLGFIDYSAFILFNLFVISVSLYASRKEEHSEDYFLAGKSLMWWAIGLSLVASNISTEHFVGMAGRGYEIGLAIASYEWMAAITLVIVAIFFLPKFLSLGIYTIPEFLEHRYGPIPRTFMAVFTLMAYILVALAAILYSGALALNTIFGINLYIGIWAIGIIAGIYTVYGGLKAVVWSDIIQGSALILGGLLVTLLGLKAIGGWDRFYELSHDKLHTVLPWNHPEMPWVAVFVGGLWIPNIFYWGLNQFITQRTLGAKSLAEGQKGILFAAALKLFIPFIIVIPGIMAYHLYGDIIAKGDQAYPVMITKLLPAGFRGIMLAALFGAVMSSLDSVLNSSSTIFTMDIYRRYINKNATSHHLVTIGRLTTAILVIVGCLYAPMIAQFESVFQYIQMIWGFISPGIVASFIVGLISKRTPSIGATGAMILGIPLYGSLLYFLPDMAFLHHMFITFTIIVIYMIIMTYVKPMEKPNALPKVNENFDLTPSPLVRTGAVAIIIATSLLYVIFY